MLRCTAKYYLLTLLTSFSCVVYAQTSNFSNPTSLRENNPYSKYGIGELWNGNSTALKSMGNITSAFQDPFLINSDNPASYASLLLTTFEGGLVGSTRNISTASGFSYSTGTASIGYLCIGIPFNSRKGGLSFGLRPYARSYYALVDTIFSPAVGSVLRSYSGEGTLSYAYLGGAYKFKKLSIGFNFGYLFGTYQGLSAVLGIDSLLTNRIYESQFAKENVIGGIYWKGGAIYETLLPDSNYVLRLGATVTLGQDLNEKVSSYKTSVFNFGDTVVNDTVFQRVESLGKLSLPGSFSIGAMLAKSDKWALGIDYTTTAWGQFSSNGDTAMNYGIASQAYKISVGGQITPNSMDKSYFSRVTYRFGFYYGTDYLRLNNTTLPNIGLTFGGSFPYRRNVRTTSRLHASFDIGRMGTTSNNLMRQNYIRFGLGLSFNEKWFIPRKYD